MTQPEALMFLLGMNEVSTDLTFIHITSCPLEERPAFDHNVPLEKLQKCSLVAVDDVYSSPSDLDCNIIFSHGVRMLKFPQLPAWHQF